MAQTRTAAIAFALALLPGLAAAQPYPSQDIHLICGAPAGSGADVIVRYYAEKLRPLVGHTLIVENKTGAMGNIATEYEARAKPDGYTVYLNGGSVLAANQNIFRNPPTDVTKSLVVAATINRMTSMLAVHTSKPIASLAELTAFLKQKGEKASYAVSNPVAQVLGELYKQKVGVQAVQVNYKAASDALNDMQSGAVDYATVDPVFALAQQREGRLRILGISVATRMKAIPDLPTMTEQGVPMDLAGWWAAFMPAGTPQPVVAQFNQWFNQVQAMDETTKFLATFGSDPWITGPAEAQARLIQDVRDWADYVKLARIEPQG